MLGVLSVVDWLSTDGEELSFWKDGERRCLEMVDRSRKRY